VNGWRQRPGLRRLAVALAVAAVYLGLWNPARVLLVAHVAAPAVEAASGVSAGPSPAHRATLLAGDGAEWPAPGGIVLAGGAVALALLGAPLAWIAALWAAHVGLSMLALGGFAIGLGGGAWGFAVQRLVEAYALPGGTLAALALAVVYRPEPRTQPRTGSGTSGEDRVGASTLDSP